MNIPLVCDLLASRSVPIRLGCSIDRGAKDPKPDKQMTNEFPTNKRPEGLKVEPAGIEPATFALQTRRSSN
jgi:hypothetical protein